MTLRKLLFGLSSALWGGFALSAGTAVIWGSTDLDIQDGALILLAGAGLMASDSCVYPH